MFCSGSGIVLFTAVLGVGAGGGLVAAKRTPPEATPQWAAAKRARNTKAARGVLSVRLVKLRGKGKDDTGAARGKVGCSLYDSEDGYPTEPEKALQKQKCGLSGRTATCRFAPIPAGTYAVACIHDENGNGTLDTNWIGIPTEGTVASNHAKGVMGPPRFDDARFSFHGKDQTLVLRMGYGGFGAADWGGRARCGRLGEGPAQARVEAILSHALRARPLQPRGPARIAD